MRKILFYILTFTALALSACTSTQSTDPPAEGATNANADEDDSIFAINTNSLPPSAKNNRFLPDEVKSVYIMTFMNETELYAIEEELNRRLPQAIQRVTDLNIAPSPSKAQAILRGRIENYISVPITRNGFGEVDFVHDRIDVSFTLKNMITGENFGTNLHHHIYYNRISMPFKSEQDVIVDFSTNIAIFTAEYLAYGYQQTLFLYGQSNRVRYNYGDDIRLVKMALTNSSLTNFVTEDE